LRKASGKQRTDGAIDLAAGQDLLLARTAFALDEAAGNASTGVGELAILNGQREEVDSFFRVGRGHGGCQNYVVAAGCERGAGGLLGHASGLKFNLLAAGKLNCHVLFHVVFLFCFIVLGTCGARSE
jgi:hypothetical protein